MFDELSTLIPYCALDTSTHYPMTISIDVVAVLLKGSTNDFHPFSEAQGTALLNPMDA